MRAREFIINIPINIRLNSDGSVDVDTDQDDRQDPSQLKPNPVMVPPLQQGLELKKAAVGKRSAVITDLTQDEEEPEQPQRQM